MSGSYPYHYLHPGDVTVTSERKAVFTILGSCLAVTFFCESPRFAAICHAMIPCTATWDEIHRRGAPVEFTADDVNHKYLCYVLRYMLRQADLRGISRDALMVKIFGAADMFFIHNGRESIGRKNIREIDRLVGEFGLKVAYRDVGGRKGRKLYFMTDTGVVMYKTIDRPNYNVMEALQEEQEALSKEYKDET